MTAIVLSAYNNYFNRIAKKPLTVNELLAYNNKHIPTYKLTVNNFDIADGIDTKITVNDVYDHHTYLVVLDDSPNPAQNYYSINSRWFIMEAKQTRGKQWELQLHRDVIADNISAFKSSVANISRGWVPNDSPLIYNSEDIRVNQIKQSETLLKDDSNMGWIIGYFDPKNGIPETSWSTKGIPYLDINSLSDVMDYTSLGTNAPKYYSYTGSTTITTYYTAVNQDMHLKVIVDYNNVNPSVLVDQEHTGQMSAPNQVDYANIVQLQTKVQTLVPVSSYNNKSYNSGTYSLADNIIYNKLAEYNGKYVYGNYGDSTTPHYYYIELVSDDMGSSSTFYTPVSKQTDNSLWTSLKLQYQNDFTVPDTAIFQINSTKTAKYHLRLTAVSNPNADINIPAVEGTTIPYMNEVAYSMFAIPYTPTSETYDGVQYTKNISFGIAAGLTKALQPAASGGSLYDIQLLPYKPELSTTKTPVKNAGGEIIGYIYYATSAHLEGTIDYSISGENAKLGNIINYYRITAPNYANDMPINPYKNYGVTGFHYTCTYKPYTPYINIHIIYKGLYGQDWDDNNGLILGGDYSLPQTSDAWRTYEIQNKNYANTFQKQYDYQDTVNKWNLAETIVGAGASAAGSGAIMSQIMGPIGTTIGTGASAIGGAADIAKTAILQQASQQYLKDQYTLNLQTIQAKPRNLVKSSSFNINSRIWPVLEYYTCTPEERTYVENYLKYNGYNIHAIGQIKNFINKTGEIGWIQGNIIHSALVDDDHMLNEINNELLRGVYIKEE